MATAAKTDAPATLAAAMARAFAQIEGATKDKTNPAFKSKYADLSSVIDAIKPALIANDLFFTQASHVAEDGVCIETVIHHSGGEALSCGKLYVPANKRDAQGFGSALTYARRYALMTVFGVPAEDDDGNAASRSAPANDRTNATTPIDEAQFAMLQQLIEKSGTNSQAFCEHYKVSSVAALPKGAFDGAVAILKKRLTQAGQKPANPQRDEVLADEIPY